ncbi:hypothetical protein Dimus_023204 [Dionaea muscipula]
MVKVDSITKDNGGDELHPALDPARETKKMRMSFIQPVSIGQPHPCPCPTGERREKSGQPGEGDSNKPAISIILSDPDVLDCPICFNPLTLPVYQCGNGHIVCSSCCGQLQNKCPSCCKPIARNNRCRGVEKVIESAKSYCCYADYGCKALVSYYELHKHQKTCKYPPCSCPFFDCLFRGSASKLSQHISLKHSVSVVRFSYNRIFPVSLKYTKWDTKSNNFIDNKNDMFIVLQEESDGVQFVVERHHGHKVNVKCVEACPNKGRFSYDLIVRDESSSLRFQSSTKILGEKKWFHLTISGFHLT